MGLPATSLLVVFPLLLLQVSCLYAPTSASNILRKALLPLILWLAWRLSYSSFDPHQLYFAWNIAAFGVLPAFAVARGIQWATVDPAAWTWVGPAPTPQGKLAWSFQAFTSMRGLNWAYGAKARLPPPLSKSTTGFLRKTLQRVVLLHLGTLIFAWPFAARVNLFDEVLFNQLGWQTSALSHRLAGMLQTICFGLIAVCCLELGFSISALTNCLFVTAAHQLGLCDAFDPSQYPPLCRDVSKTQSIRDFWSHRWHSLFLSDFLFLGFRPGRALGQALQLPKAASYLLGVVATFIVSGVGHEFALYTCSREFGLDPHLRTFWAFALQAAGMAAEQLYTKITGRRVGGWLGTLWSIGFVAWAFSFMVDAWLERHLITGVPHYADWKLQRFLMPFAPVLPYWISTTT